MNNTKMVERRVREALESAVVDQPPYVGTCEEVVHAARPGVRGRRWALAGATVGALALVGVAAAQGWDLRLGGARETPVEVSPANQAPAPRDHLPTEGDAATIGAAIRAASPQDFRLYLDQSYADVGSLDVDGWVDDGAGRSRLYLATAGPDSIMWDPCGSPDFAHAAACVTRDLANGDRLVLIGEIKYRAHAPAKGWVRWITVEVIHPDRSGLHVESANSWSPKQGEAENAPDPAEHVDREHPAYTLEQLARVARAVDAALAAGA